MSCCGEDAEAQTDEMTALSAILTEDEFTQFTPPPPSPSPSAPTTTLSTLLLSGTIKIHPTPNHSSKQNKFRILITPSSSPIPTITVGGGAGGGGGGPPPEPVVVELTHLPPLSIHFILPPNYPSTAPPIYTLSAQWIQRSRLAVLCSLLDKDWLENPHTPILFTWINTLREKLLESVLEELGEDGEEEEEVVVDMTWFNNNNTINQEEKEVLHLSKIKKNKEEVTNLLDSRGVFEPPPPAAEGGGDGGDDGDMLQFLRKYDSLRDAQVFGRSYHSCCICLCEKVGVDCGRLVGCGHAFCSPCLHQYVSQRIHDGEPVTCPQVDCKVEARPHEIEKIVGRVEFERYDSILLNRSLESMQDIFYCPRHNCQAPLIAEPEEGKLGICGVCSYSFCLSCKSVYHGVQPCRFKAQERERVCREYRDGSAEERSRLEKQFGRRPLTLLLESLDSEAWIQSCSKKCPHCSVPIQKFEGCNKVTCSKCHTYFCWICQEQLSANNPYYHFNNPTSPCFNNLFRDEEEEEEEEEVEEGGGGRGGGGGESSSEEEEEEDDLFQEDEVDEVVEFEEALVRHNQQLFL